MCHLRTSNTYCIYRTIVRAPCGCDCTEDRQALQINCHVGIRVNNNTLFQKKWHIPTQRWSRPPQPVWSRFWSRSHPTKCTQDPARIQPRHTSTLISTCTHPADRDRSSRCIFLICTWDYYSDAGAPTHPRTVIIIHYSVFEEAPAQPSPPIDHHSSGLGCPEAAPKWPRGGPEAARGGLGPTENRSHGGSKLPLRRPTRTASTVITMASL